jgi:two-component system sensor histidine kinase CiaH
MEDTARKKLRLTTIIYWLMLVYIMAALVWWFVSLLQQNASIASQQVNNLELRKGQMSREQFDSERDEILSEKKRNSGKYVAEGVTFFLLLLVGAVFVYRSVRRQFLVQIQQQHFMMAVTHELKTPIAVVKLNLETLQKYNLEPEKQARLIRTTLDEITRLNRLTSNILVSSQLEGDGYTSTKDELDLGDLLKDCMLDFRTRFPERKFNELIEDEAEVRGDPLLLQMLINNLLENAIKYSDRESPVTAVLKKKGRQTELQIIDEGPGIPEQEKKKIFDKFYRVGNEETRKAQGTGLGLYLCRKIARDHNADISVTNETPSGSKFVVVFKN